MNERDILYQSLLNAQEQRKRENFNYFMDKLEGTLISDLDKIYASGNQEQYRTLVHNIKEKLGYKVYRNGEGKHKLNNK